jgi:hypothetical protein
MPHLSGKLLETLRELFGHPEPANLEWRDVFTLIRQYGHVEQRKNGHLVLCVRDECLNFAEPLNRLLQQNRPCADAGSGRPERRLPRSASFPPRSQPSSPESAEIGS